MARDAMTVRSERHLVQTVVCLAAIALTVQGCQFHCNTSLCGGEVREVSMLFPTGVMTDDGQIQTHFFTALDLSRRNITGFFSGKVSESNCSRNTPG